VCLKRRIVVLLERLVVRNAHGLAPLVFSQRRAFDCTDNVSRLLFKHTLGRVLLIRLID